MDHPALAENHHPVSQPQNFGNLAGDQKYGEAFVGEATDDRVQLGAGADVDTAGGFVEQQDAAAAQQPAGQDGLLLIAAGQCPDRDGRVVGAQRQLTCRGAGGASLGAPVDPTPV